MTSEKQKNAGWILPAQLTGHDLVCLTLQIPDVAEYRAAVRGALNELGKWWAWDKGGYGDTRATQAATYWRALLEDLAIGECGAETMFDVRQNEEAPCTLEKTTDGETWQPWADLQLCPPRLRRLGNGFQVSVDGGATWQPVQDDTYTEYDWRQDEPLRPARTGDDKRCLAAANAAAVFVELHREIVAWYESEGTLLQIGIAVSAVIAIMFPAGWPVVAGGLLTGAGAAVLQWSQALTNTAFSQSIQDQLRCIFWTWADENGRWSESAFSAVLADVEGQSGDMWRLLEIYLEQIGGYTGLNNAGTTTSVMTADCVDCTGEWCYEFDFAAGQQEWQYGGFNDGYVDAIWTGSGWTSSFYLGWRILGIRHAIPAGTVITAVEVTGACTTGATNQSGITWCWDLWSSGQFFSSPWVAGTPIAPPIWEGSIETGSSLGIRALVSQHSGGADSGGSASVTKVLIRGYGINPFGEDNCT